MKVWNANLAPEGMVDVGFRIGVLVLNGFALVLMGVSISVSKYILPLGWASGVINIVIQFIIIAIHFLERLRNVKWTKMFFMGLELAALGLSLASFSFMTRGPNSCGMYLFKGQADSWDTFLGRQHNNEKRTIHEGGENSGYSGENGYVENNEYGGESGYVENNGYGGESGIADVDESPVYPPDGGYGEDDTPDYPM